MSFAARGEAVGIRHYMHPIPESSHYTPSESQILPSQGYGHAIKRRHCQVSVAIGVGAAVLLVGCSGIETLKPESGETPETPTAPSATAEQAAGVGETPSGPETGPSASSSPESSGHRADKEAMSGDVYDLPRKEQIEILGLKNPPRVYEATPGDIAKFRVDIPGARPGGTLMVGGLSMTVVHVPFTVRNSGLGVTGSMLGKNMTEREAAKWLDRHPHAVSFPVVNNIVAATARDKGDQIAPWDKSALDATNIYALGATCTKDGMRELISNGNDLLVLNGNAAIVAEKGTYECSVSLITQTPNQPGAVVTGDIAYSADFAVFRGQDDPDSGVTTTSFGGSEVIATITLRFGADGKTVEEIS